MDRLAHVSAVPFFGISLTDVPPAICGRDTVASRAAKSHIVQLTATLPG